VQAGLVGLLALTLPPLPVLLTVVGLRALTAQVFAPASRSAMPFLVEDQGLEAANATLGLGSNSSEVLGPLLAAVLFPVLGVRGVLAVDAATFVLSAVALRRLPSLPRSRTERPTFLRDARSGLQYVWATRPVRVIVAGFCGVVLANGIDDVAVVFLVQDTLGGGGSATAVTLAGAGAGLLVGFAVLARVRKPLPMALVFTAGLALNSVGNLLTGLSWAVAAAVLLQTVRGLGIAAGDVASTTLVQRMVPAEMTGRVFANLYGLVGICAGISYVGGSLLLDATSPRVTFLVAGTLGVVIAALTGWRLVPAGRRGDVSWGGRR
jgi:hypothetical protein